MRRLASLCLAVLLGAGLSLAAPKSGKGAKTFVGDISDSMCGLKHMMPGSAKDCTFECVKGGARLVLAETATGKVYELSDQAKAKDFAGQKVKVTGTLKGKTIEVASLEAAQ
jgi:hypothetical protein